MNILLLDRFLAMPSQLDFWLTVVLCLINVPICIFMSIKFLQVLQLSGYKVKGVFSWLKETKFVSIVRILFVTLLSGATLVITNVLISNITDFRALNYLSIVFYFLFAGVYIINLQTIKQKTPIKYTRRMNRIIAVCACLSFVISFALMYVSVNYIPYFTTGGVIVLPALVIVICLLSHYLVVPLEKLIAKRYVTKAKNRLKTLNLKVIGVTGSYGKTTVKNMIASLLAQKYKVCVSPYSYNTPLGLSKTILENLEDTDEILVAEMGARNVGDIKELANMVEPSIGVITGIGNQHMSTFGSMQNLVKTKSELTDYVTEHGGTMVFNTDSTEALQMYTNAKCTKFETGLKGSGIVKAENIKSNSKGSVFTLVIGDKKYKNVQTSLLGEHNISNILVAVSVAKLFKLEDEKIIDAISKLIPTAHRLALMPSANALTIIDDAYNGSVEGSKSALKVLQTFEGKKVVITPGLVELGKEQFNSNFEFGLAMSKVCDYVIICGVVNYEAISGGLEFGGFSSSKIIRAGTLEQAVSMLASITNPGDVVLFENDLPDNYL